MHILSKAVPERSPDLQQSPTTIYTFAVIVEPVADTQKERQCLTACFREYPFPKEINSWAQSLTGNDYRVVDSFPLEEISL